MAIIQISKIQQRSGNLVDLPQLDEAQFGWASDAKRLFIGKTTPNENIEVLTSYSNISFSQIDGSGGSNVNIDANALQNGQLLTYVETTNTWENYTGNSSQIGNSKIQLGDVANISMAGGSTGFVLQTDGLGNLSWTPKTTIVANIVALSNATPIVMTVNNTTPYTNGTEITISGVDGNANSNVNSTNFYIELAVDFPTSGNVSLYTDSGLTIGADGTGLEYDNSPNALAITTVGGTSTLVAAGSNTSIQFNNGGTLQGSPYFTILNGNGLLTHTGPHFSVGNVFANSGAVVASQLTGSLMTNAQPNITSVGTLTSVSVSGNANVGNLNTAGNVIASQVTANSNGTGNNFKVGDDAYIGDINIVNTMVVKGQQDGTQGYIVFGNTNTTNYIGRNGSNAITVTGAFSVTGNANVGNIGATGGVFTTVAGSLTTAAQPNITSTGTLAGLEVSGSITPSANITYDLGNTTNRFKDLYLSNSTIYLGGQTISANSSGVIMSGNLSANITGNVTGNATTAATVTTAAQPNITSTGTLVSLSVSGNANIGNIGTAGLITATGNINGGNINATAFYGAGTGLTSIPGGNVTGAVAYATTSNSVAGANVSGTVSSATTAGTVTTAAQPNITSIGTLTSLSVSGNANVGNLGTGGLITATGNITGGNLVTGGAVSASGNASVLGIKTDNYYYANGVSISFAGSYSNSNVASYLPTFTGTVGATALTTGANTTVGTIIGDWGLSAGSKLSATYADLAEYYEADAHYEPGTVLAFGGEKEVTIAEDGTTRVAGVVSTDPAYAMNAKCPGEHVVALALQGRVPTKVRGSIRKGDMMVSAGNGYARPWNSPQMGTVIGKALENFDGIEGVIEIAVGRL